MAFRRCAWLLVLLSSIAWADTKSHADRVPHRTVSSKLPVTTKSPRARAHFQKAIENLEEVRLNDLVTELRLAVKADPKFAEAWILLSHFSRDPQEQQVARTHAKQLAARVSPGERLLIRWIASAEEDQYIPAIAAMNDLLARYPQDAQLALMAGGWLSVQGRYEQAIPVLQRAINLQPDYPAALNELAYAYAFTGEYTKPVELMERYVALQPDEPNPHDSYGEILRMAGKFDTALEQYRMSIKIDPMFGSELGVADTYALMGKEEEARDEYARAITFSPNQSDRIEFELKSAVTWIRENNRHQAEKSLRAVAKHAHTVGLGKLEAESHRVLAMYEPDYKATIKELDAAQKALDEPHQLPKVDRDEEHARILLIRVIRSAEAQEMQTAHAAEKQLDAMAQSSRSQVIQLAWNAAKGAVLAAETKYAEAVEYLQEGGSDPLSLRLLWHAYRSMGQSTQAMEVANKLAALNVPTVEQAIVVPPFRASLVSQAQEPQ